jgi:hypothetical protein
MDVEGGENETRWGPAKEIVRTPGVALRSASRRPRATPAPAPTPAAGTLRRSQRSTARKSAAPAEAEVAATARRSTRKAAKLNMAIDFDQVEEEEKVQAVEPKGESDLFPLINFAWLFNWLGCWRQFLMRILRSYRYRCCF